MKRMMPRARGSGSQILKRSSHIRIILTDEIEIKTRDKKKGQKKGSRKAPVAPAKSEEQGARKTKAAPKKVVEEPTEAKE